MFHEQLLHTQILKAQKDSKLVTLFVLLGSALAKAASRTLMKLNPDQKELVQGLQKSSE